MLFKKENPYINSVLGFVSGDVLGLPYEFKKRNELEYKGLIGYGTHNQPLGTWSDDTAVVYIFLCSLDDNNKFDINKYKKNLINWMYKGKYTCDGLLPFDIGKQTSKAITNLKMRVNYFDLNQFDYNGNIGLLRIFPYALYLKNNDIKPTIDNIKEFVSITNPHKISILCCYYYALIIWYLDKLDSKEYIIKNVIKEFKKVLTTKDAIFFEPLLYVNLIHDGHSSDGYIYDTLKVVVRNFLKDLTLEESLKEIILTGGDTDSNAALLGALNGFYYNKKTKWKKKILNLDMIENLSKNYFSNKKPLI